MINLLNKVNTINITTLLIGIALGITISILLYVIFIILSLKPKKIKIQEDLSFSKDELDTLINEKKLKFNDKHLRKELGTFPLFKSTSMELVNEIANKFYPNKKYPLLELNLDEIIRLNKIITKKLETLLNKPIISLVKKIKISNIRQGYEIKKNLDNNEGAQKVVKVAKAALFVNKIINIANPYAYIPKITIKLVSHYTFANIFNFIGVETYNVYSKKIFNKELDIDLDSDKSLKELTQKIKKELKGDLNSGNILEKLIQYIDEDIDEINNEIKEEKKKKKQANA